MPRLLCGNPGLAEHSARGVFQDVNSEASGRDPLGARDSVNPHVLGGTPVFSGTRVPVRIFSIKSTQQLWQVLPEF